MVGQMSGIGKFDRMKRAIESQPVRTYHRFCSVPFGNGWNSINGNLSSMRGSDTGICNRHLELDSGMAMAVTLNRPAWCQIHITMARRLLHALDSGHQVNLALPSNMPICGYGRPI